MKEVRTDILIVGGSFGGVAAAIAAVKSGSRVIITEETSWLGGQATTQGVPLDEHPWIESYGRSASYADFRNRIRSYYRNNYPLTERARNDRYLNPGACWVSALGFEPKAGLAVLDEMLAPYTTNGNVLIWYNTIATSVEMDGDRCSYVTVKNLNSGLEQQVSSRYVLDATELGDILELSGTEFVIGAESQAETGEPLAVPGEALPLRQQPFTHLIALDYHPGENHVIDRPEGYDQFLPAYKKIKGYSSVRQANNIIGQTIPDGLFTHRATAGYETSLWNFRRWFYCGNFDPSVFDSDVTSLMNGNEYHDGVLVGVSETEAKFHLEQAKKLSLGLVYYLQTEVEDGYNGKQGFPGLRLRPDAFGTSDGLAQYPYIRESRRIRAEFTVLEQHFRIDMNPNGPMQYPDTVGVAGYRIDIHEKSRKGNESITSAEHGKHWTQQLPLGALIPQRVENILPCCKNIGVTHVTNGAFRLHPVEWNIGEVAGALASYCIQNRVSPRAVRNTDKLLKAFQQELDKRGVERFWPEQNFGRSYFSHMRNDPEYQFGETDKQ